MSYPTLRLPERVYAETPKAHPIMEQYPLYGLEYPGTLNNYPTVADDPSLRLTTFTIGMWLKSLVPIGAGAEQLMVKASGVVPAGENYNFNWSHGVAGFQQAWGFRDTTDTWRPFKYLTTLVQDVWCYLIWTYTSVTGVGNIYLNAALDRQIILGAGVTPKTTLGALDLTNRSAPLNCIMAMPQIYNVVLTGQEIDWNMRNPMNPVRRGLALWLPMIEGLGAAIADFSGLGNNGAIIGNVDWYKMALHEALADVL